MFAQNGMVKPKTADDILGDRRQIEDLLAAWLVEWDAYCIAKGWDPRGTLRPIEDVLRERNAARPPSLTVAAAIRKLQSMPSDAAVTALVVDFVGCDQVRK